MNHPDFQEWKQHHLTSSILNEITNRAIELKSRPLTGCTIEEIAINAIKTESFLEGMSYFAQWVDDLEFQAKSEAKNNED